MIRRSMLLLLLLAMLAQPLATYAASVPAQRATSAALAPNAGPTLVARPSAVAPGGQVALMGYDLPTALSYRVIVPGPPRDVTLASSAAFGREYFQAKATIRDYPPGPLTLALQASSDGSWTTITTTTVTVLGGLNLSYSPQSGPPGTTVNVTVTGLRPGKLQLDYDGERVLGPLTVSGSSWSGSFVVPNNRPDPLGSETVIEAINLVNRVPVNSGFGLFQSVSPPVPQTRNISGLSAPPVGRGGEPITMTGTISPAPGADASRYKPRVIRRSGGTTALLEVRSSSVQSGGAFQVIAEQSGLRSGNSIPAGSGGSIQIIFETPGGLVSSSELTVSPSTDLYPLIKVVDRSTGVPIPDAAVVIQQVEPGEVCKEVPPAGQPPLLGRNPDDVTYPPLTQFGSIYQQWGVDQRGINTSLNAQTSNFRLTDATGTASFALSEDQLLFGAPMAAAAPAIGGKKKAPTAGSEICYTADFFKINITASSTGIYTAGVAPNIDAWTYNPEVIELGYLASKGFVDLETQLPVTWPMTLSLGRKPWTYDGIPDVSTSADGVKCDASYLGDSSCAGGVSAVGLTGVNIAGIENGPITFKLYAPKHKVMDIVISDVRFFLEVPGADDSLDVLGPTTFTGGNGNTAKLYTANYNAPYTTLISDVHKIRVEIDSELLNLKPGTATQILYIDLEIAGPPAWFLDSATTNRVMKFDRETGISELRGTRPGDRQEANTNPAQPLEYTGALNNDTGIGTNTSIVTIDANRHTTNRVQGNIENKAVNNNAPPAAVPPNTQGAGSTTIRLRTCNQIPFFCTGNGPIDKVTILDTGWVPAYRNSWGIWPIASATVGVDTWFKGELEMSMTIKIVNETIKASSLYLHPYATVGVKAMLDITVLAGLVEASMTAIPQITLDMGATLNSFHDPDDMYFSGLTGGLDYKLDIAWYAKVGVCTIGLCKEKSDTIHVFDGPPIRIAEKHIVGQLERIAAMVIEAPAFDPSVATDGFGETTTIWTNLEGDLVSSRFDGTEWEVPPTVVDNAIKAAQPEHVYYAPGLGIAVWQEIGLSQAQLSTATMSDTVRSTKLMWSQITTNGWTDPQVLTAPGNGVGNISLAACMSTIDDCPTGGAVTAVWVQDTSSAAEGMNARKFRVYYSTFTNGAWSTPAPVTTNTTVTDSQPQVLYLPDGTRYVAWIRDLDRNLGTFANRGIVICTLAPTCAPVAPPSLPQGIAEFSIEIGPNGQPQIAFTLVEQTGAGTTKQGGILGNRHFLYVGSYNGTSWSYLKVRDSLGRSFRAEKPELLIDGTGLGTITMRGLGFGPNPSGLYAKGNEPLGMQTGTGDTAQIKVDFSKPLATNKSFNPIYLSTDGLINWKADSFFNPATREVVTIFVKGINRVQAAHMPTGLMAPDLSLGFGSTPSMAELEVVSATLSSEHLLTNQLTATVMVQNSGTSIDSAITIPLAASWDGGYGVGTAAGAISVAGLEAGESRLVQVPLTFAGLVPTSTHKLTIAFNPGLLIDEQGYETNEIMLNVARLPTPSDILAAAQSESQAVFLDWTKATQPQIVGYRIYRSDAGGAFVPIGTTSVGGYVDVQTLPSASYAYAVTAYDALGNESPLSAPIYVDIPSAGGGGLYLPLIRQ